MHKPGEVEQNEERVVEDEKEEEEEDTSPGRKPFPGSPRPGGTEPSSQANVSSCLRQS